MDARVAIVTGSAHGIGKAIVLALARRDIFPVVVDIDKDAADRTVEQLRLEGRDALSYKADVSNVDQIAALVNEVTERCDSIDILINNAGVLSKASLVDLDEAEWERVMGVNVKSAAFLMKYVVKRMMEKRWGRIVTISSLAGRMGGYATGCAYSTSKAALLGLTMCVARKVAAFGISGNAIAPGTTETELVKGFSERESEDLKRSIPIGKLVKPEGIAEAVCFLVSDSAEFITGAVLDVNGGMFMG